MLYDYLITQFCPNLNSLVWLHILASVVAIVVYAVRRMWIGDFGTKEETQQFTKKWGKKLSIFLGFQLFALLFYFWIPDVEYVKHFYGDVRVVEITPQQKAELQAQYDKHYEQSKQLLLDCLEKGQKQPHTTAFNDTNEVVKTCYNVAKYKF